MLRCVYTDLDGTLLTAGSLFRDADGGFTLMPARALEACHRAGVEVVIKSGRRKAQVMEDARLMGQTAYIYEMGCGLVIDGEETMFTGDLQPADGRSIHDQIEDSGAPRLLLETYAGLARVPRALAPEPRDLAPDARAGGRWRGRRPARPSTATATCAWWTTARSCRAPPCPTSPGPPHVYHLMPKHASKADAVVRHMRARGYTPEDCIAVGDSREDLGVAPPWAASSSWRTPCRRTPTSCVALPPTSRSPRAATARASTRP